MTTHLRDAEFVDFAEGNLAAPRAAHLDACAECRERAEDVAVALREVSDIDMPEPSPIFWEHFSARVRQQVAHETPERAAWWSMIGARVLVPLVAAIAMVIAIVSAPLLPRLIERSTPTAGELVSSHSAADTSLAAAADTDFLAPVDEQNADVWDVLTAAASDIGIDEAHAAGMGVHVGAVDHELNHLNQAELKELGRLLQSELKRPSD